MDDINKESLIGLVSFRIEMHYLTSQLDLVVLKLTEPVFRTRKNDI